MLHSARFFPYLLLSPQRVGAWGVEGEEGRIIQIGWQMKRRKLKGYENKSQWAYGAMSIFFLWKS